MSEPAKEGSLLGLWYANREGLVGDGCLETVLGTVISFQFSRSKEGAQQKCCLGLLNRAYSGLFRRQIDRVPWDSPVGQRSP